MCFSTFLVKREILRKKPTGYGLNVQSPFKKNDKQSKHWQAHCPNIVQHFDEKLVQKF